jgi:hypothetical protein
MVGDELVRITDNYPVGRRVFEAGDEAYLAFGAGDAHVM